MMDLHGDDLDAAYFLAHRFVDPMKAAGRPVNHTILSFCQKVDVAWEMSAGGPENSDAAGPLTSALIDTAEVASILNVTNRQVRRLVNDLDGRKCGAVWLFPRKTVTEYAEARSGRTRPTS